jgi:DnaA family protein
MKQLLLDLAAPPPTLDSFVAGRNTELLALLARVAASQVSDLNERFIYLWGEAGAGKTHLLKALEAAGGTYIAGCAPPASFVWKPACRLYLLDDCDQLWAEAQVAAFDLFNQVREQGGVLVAAGPKPPAGLELREDLRTRFGWGLVYQVHGLSDDEKIAALEQAAHTRGLMLSPGILPYLMTHFQRDMASLSAMLDALDRYSLQTKRPITLPLLKDLLQEDGAPR